ncbi:MAG: glycosyltransferase [Gaiellaceae bacterium MAG52_C11]|nr:glycosyltransferase [Candidatus Gaiellasilicea maunaloa]
MKRVLVLAYYFPPLGGAGVQRTVKFLKHLPDRGYEAVVVTGPERASVDWSPPDTTLFADVPPSTTVIRIDASPPAGRDPNARLRRLLGRPSRLDAWWRREALEAARSAIGDVDLIYASLSPFGSAPVAARLAEESGLPWVADLRDPWALDEWATYPSALHRRLERRRMRSALSSAHAIVMNTKEAGSALLAAFPELAGRHLAVIPNGWDRDDFARPAPRRDDDAFRIVYAGYSHVRAGLRHRRLQLVRRSLGGASPGIGRLARSHALLAEALTRLDESEPELAGRVELHVAGAAPAGENDAASAHVVHRGYLPHPEAVDLMRSADLIFLPMHDLPEGVRARTVMGKTYEYLASGRPILGALPDGDARDLLAALPNVWLCRPAAIDCMAAAVRDVMLSPPEGATATEALLERLERGALAVDLARLFDTVMADHIGSQRRVVPSSSR